MNNNNAVYKIPFYYQTWFILIMFIFFFPIAIILAFSRSAKYMLVPRESTLKAEPQTSAIDLEGVFEYTKINYDQNLSSNELNSKLKLLKVKEKELISDNKAINLTSEMTRKEIKEQSKQILRTFNAEAELFLSQLTYKNIDSTKNKLIKSFETLNKIYKIDNISMDSKLLEIKLQEFDLIAEVQIRKQQEKEQQIAIKEQMKEEERVRKEIEKEKAKIDKEKNQFSSEITKLTGYLQKTDSEVEKQLYLDKIKELEEKLKTLEEDEKRVFDREANTRAGYVYVISNIGSFGENIYKIGMTRRLEPMDRVKELSSASVPFEFDVHAMIFSDDAPALENLLHNTFEKNKVNKINPRKEFFRVDLNEIANLVKDKFNATTEFTMLAKAEQYRETLELEKQDK